MADVMGMGKCVICYKQINEGAPIGSPQLPRTGIAHKGCADREQFVPPSEAGPPQLDPTAAFQRPKPHLLVGQSESTFKDKVAEHNARIDGPPLPPMEEEVVAAPEAPPAPRKWEPGMDLPPQHVTQWDSTSVPTADEFVNQLKQNGVPVSDNALSIKAEGITIEQATMMKTLLDAGLSVDKVVEILNALKR